MMSLLMSALLGAAFQSAATPPVEPLPGVVAPAKAFQRARVRGVLPHLFSADDYPAAALLKGEQGIVGVKLYIDRAGRVAQCFVTESSGSSSLDSTTCGIIRGRARLTPATDASGRAVEDDATARIKWELPVAPPLGIEDLYERIILTHDKQANISRCRSESSNLKALPTVTPQCSFFTKVAVNLKQRFDGRIVFAGRDLVLQSGTGIGGVAAVRDIGRGPEENLLTMNAVALTIDASGTVVTCVEAEGSTAGPASPCSRAERMTFVPLAAAEANQADREAVVYDASFTRPIR